MLKTTRLPFFKITKRYLALVLLIAIPAMLPAAYAAQTQPNIILFLADDMGQGDTSVYQDFTRNADREQVLTPNMQRLADSGVRLTDAHSASATCNPSRQAIMSGEFARRDPLNTPTMEQALRRGGYRIYGVGKWHLPFKHGTPPGNAPIERGPFSFGFDRYLGTDHNVRKSASYFMDRTVLRYDEQTGTLSPNDDAKEPGYDQPGGPREEISQQLWLDYSRKWMSDHLSGAPHQDSPFFLYYASHANHTNYRPAEAIDGIPVSGSTRTVDGRILASSRDGLIRERSEMIHENDVALGILLDWLDATEDPRNPGHNLADNTLFVFISDNGSDADAEAPGQGRLRGRKLTEWEGGNRVPYIARWGSRFPAGSTSGATVSGVDLFATFATAAGVSLNADEALDSFNLLEIMSSPTPDSRGRPQGIHTMLGDQIRATRLDSFKAVEPKKSDGKIELYDLQKDLAESKNLAGNPEYKQQETALRQALAQSLENGRTRPTK